jgi:mono/diheme cytochrome c family protein
MKKGFKVVGIIIVILLVGVGALLAYVKLALPNTGEPDATLKIEITPERVARGKYLANSVSVCMDCHSKRDWSQFSGPIPEGTALGGGGEVFDQKIGMPGVIYSRNITPAGIGDWTDGEILRTITTGVTKHGKAMFPLMPYPSYGKMDIEDIYSIIAYIRTLQPVKNEVPESKLDFPMNFIVNTIPSKASFTKKPEETDVIAYGKYLVNAGGCGECHTKFEKGQLVAGTEFGGGREFQFPGGLVTSANISPDDETGIGMWSKELFVSKFKTYLDSNYHSPALAMTDFNTPMPWTMYATMKQSDLEAIYAYLRTVDAKKNMVTKFKPNTAVAAK